MITQHYRMIVSEPGLLEIGQIVFVNNSSTISGFIHRANSATGVAEVILFEPMDVTMNEGMESISPVRETWERDYATALINASEHVKNMWRRSLLNQR